MISRQNPEEFERTKKFVFNFRKTWWTSNIFYFFLLGEGEGGVRGARSGGRGGGRFSIENPRRGSLQDGRGRGAGRVSAANWGIFGGGGLSIFFGGRNVNQEKRTPTNYFWAIQSPYRCRLEGIFSKLFCAFGPYDFLEK